MVIDTLVEGVHFFPDAPPESIGHRAMAVNLSDLAAMGAKPRWLLLALTLKEAEPDWLASFRKGLLVLIERYGLDLIGGDTTRGPCCVVTVTAIGEVSPKLALRREGARVGDGIYVSGTLGDSALGLKMLLGEVAWRCETVIRRHLFPEPQIEAGLALRGQATACIDLSDGLLADLGHILEMSGVGALIEWEALPLSPEVERYIAETGDFKLPLSGGEDYKLCWTLPPSLERELKGFFWRRIGTVEARPGIRLRRAGQVISLAPRGYRHF